MSKKVLIDIVTWMLRILTGATFIVSGFVKAIDPWGTLYKFEDYMAAMNLPIIHNLLLTAVFMLCAAEFLIGVCLCLGCFRRSTPIAGFVFMAVMLPLTVWIAFWNPVSDCGCFGDAIVISNMATMWKNVVLTAAFIWLLKFNTREICLVRPSLQWIASIATCTYIIIISLIGYHYQPLIDFRPYPVGSRLVAQSSDADDSNADDTEDTDDNLRFIYARNRVEKSFSIDDELPDESEGWVFVRREEVPKNDDTKQQEKVQKENSEEGTLRIWNEDGTEDVTDEILSGDDKMIILFMPDLKSVSVATTWQINSLYTWASENGIDMIGVVSGDKKEIENWKDLSLAAYPIYSAEDIEIKMAVRGNPAIIYLDNGIIEWKSSLRALDIADFLAPSASDDLDSYARDNKAILRNISCVYIIVTLMLIFLTFASRKLPKLFKTRKEKELEKVDKELEDQETSTKDSPKDIQE